MYGYVDAATGGYKLLSGATLCEAMYAAAQEDPTNPQVKAPLAAKQTVHRPGPRMRSPRAAHGAIGCVDMQSVQTAALRQRVGRSGATAVALGWSTRELRELGETCWQPCAEAWTTAPRRTYACTSGTTTTP